jgi:hypothetical protein
MQVLGSIEEASPAWLTEVLRQAGVLERGRVEEVTARLNEAFNSKVAHLSLTYSSDAPPLHPLKLY